MDLGSDDDDSELDIDEITTPVTGKRSPSSSEEVSIPTTDRW